MRELARRQRRLRDLVGDQIAETRLEAGVSQAALAAAAQIDPGHLSRLERGLSKPSLEVLVAIAAALGADLGVRLFPGTGPRLRDRFQAPMIEALIRALHARWVAVPELPVPRARGFVDLGLGLRGVGMGVACEAHSELRAIEKIQRRLHEKALAVAELGTFGPDVSTMLFVRSTERTRDIARLYEATLAAAFPARSKDAYAALTGATLPWPGPTILWVRLEEGRAEILPNPPRGVHVGR